MKEKLLALWQRIEANLRVVAFLVFALLLGVIFYLRGSGVTDTGTPVERRPAELKPPEEWAEITSKVVAVVEESPKPVEETPLAALIADNMFDVKAIQSATEKIAEADRRYREAKLLFDQAKYFEALKKCDEALAVLPTHLASQRLKKQAEEKVRRVLPGPGSTP